MRGFSFAFDLVDDKREQGEAIEIDDSSPVTLKDGEDITGKADDQSQPQILTAWKLSQEELVTDQEDDAFREFNVLEIQNDNGEVIHLKMVADLGEWEEDSDLDIIPNVYEGGLKIWESSIDLVRFMLNGGIGKLNGKRVIELGCGHGFPGILALLNGASEVTFCDFNSSVLSQATAPAVGKNVGSLDQSKFFAGDWASLPDAVGLNAPFDLVLSSETIYTEERAIGVARALTALLSKNRGATAYVSGKRYYFGTRGGSDAFRSALKEIDSSFSITVPLKVDNLGGNIREIMRISRE
eukprot:425154_1